MSIRDREILQTTLARAKTEAWHMTRDLRKAFQELLWTEQIPYVKSVSEADDVLIDLINGGKLDVIMSSDMDYLLGGTPRLWIPTNKATNYFEEVLLADVLDGEGFSAAAFLDGCLLCGTEEREGAKGVPPHIAFGWIRHYGSLEGLLKSNITDTTFRKMFPTVEAIAVARATVVAQEPYSRIRSDHLERVREFIDGL
jgi:5'-3' exonuclease